MVQENCLSGTLSYQPLYRQIHYQRDPRRRETEQIDKAIHEVVDRTKLYNSLYLLYSIERHANPTGTTDNDQYLIQISAPSDVTLDNIQGWITAYLESAGSGVKLETLYTGM